MGTISRALGRDWKAYQVSTAANKSEGLRVRFARDAKQTDGLFIKGLGWINADKATDLKTTLYSNTLNKMIKSLGYELSSPDKTVGTDNKAKAHKDFIQSLPNEIKVHFKSKNNKNPEIHDNVQVSKILSFNETIEVISAIKKSGYRESRFQKLDAKLFGKDKYILAVDCSKYKAVDKSLAELEKSTKKALEQLGINISEDNKVKSSSTIRADELSMRQSSTSNPRTNVFNAKFFQQTTENVGNKSSLLVT